MVIIRKAKGPYIFYLNKKNKYFDFSSNSNILGYSFKKLTTIVKNDISSRWNIKRYSIYHRRMEKLLTRLYGSCYVWKYCFSLKEFFLRLLPYFNINIKGKYLQEWFNTNFSSFFKNSSKQSITLFDMAYYYLFSREIENEGGYKIGNYYFYPELDFNLINFDIIILQEFLSGNFCYLNILVKKGSIFENIFDNTNDIPSLYISSSLKNYYLIKRYKNKFKNFLDQNLFYQKNRLFVLKKVEDKILEYLFSKRVIINSSLPFYNYLPIILEEHQIKYLESLKMV